MGYVQGRNRRDCSGNRFRGVVGQGERGFIAQKSRCKEQTEQVQSCQPFDGKAVLHSLRKAVLPPGEQGQERKHEQYMDLQR